MEDEEKIIVVSRECESMDLERVGRRCWTVVWSVVEFALWSREAGICARNAPEAVAKRDDGVGQLRTNGRDCGRNALQFPPNPEEMRRVEGGMRGGRWLSECLGRERSLAGGPGDKRKLEIGKGRKRSSEHHPERQWLGSTLCYGEWGDV
jgi:hypothetical protein